MWLYILIIFIVLIMMTLLYKWISLQPYNQKPLRIKTFDGLNSPYHPSVIFFENGWCGWRYWMTETPFSPDCKPYRDCNECPSLHVSNDGINWFEPIANPLVKLTEKEIEELDYFSDSQLVFVDNHLECFYRHTHRHGVENDFSNVSIHKLTSYDGISWSNSKIVLDIDFDIVSPAIVYSSECGYIMWFVDSENHYEHRNIRYMFSKDYINWSEPAVCQLTGNNINPWHIDVQEIDGYYYLTIYDFQDISLWRGIVGSPGKFEYVQTLLQPASKKYGSFYSNGLYRSCLVKSNLGLELFFSADDSRQTYIGRMVCKQEDIIHKGPLEFDFMTEGGKFSNFNHFICKSIYGYRRWASFIIRNTLRRL